MKHSLTLLATVACVCGSVFAQGSGPDGPGAGDEAEWSNEAGGGWTFEITPYLWIPAQSGDVAVRGNPASVDLSVGDTFDTVSDNFNFGLTLHLEARNGRWAVFGDAMYLSLENDGVQLQSGPATVRQDQGIFELGAAYRVYEREVADENGSFYIEPLAGVRIHTQSLEIEPTGAAEVSGDKTWVDGFVGVRGGVTLVPRLAVVGRADIGTGGSDFTWNALAGLEFTITDWAVLLAGYRGLDIDYSDGHGAERYSYDVLLHGPFVAFTFRF